MADNTELKSLKPKEKLEELPKEILEEIMKDLEYKVNPKSIKDGLNLIDTNNVNKTMGPMIAGTKEFENKVGRRMTYGEIRETWG